MHQLDLGLFKRMIEYTEQMFAHDSNIKILIDYRLFINKGLFTMSNATAKEYRDIMKVTPFVIHGLGPEKLANNFVDFNKMYLLSEGDHFTDDEYRIIHVPN